MWATVGLLSTVLWGGCEEKKAAEEPPSQSMMTQQSEKLTVRQTKEGKLVYQFTTPLLEEYEYAPEPYIEFRKGIKIVTYNDSTQQVSATLSANYAIFMKNQQLWEAKGNVAGHNADGNQIETEQLFWNQKTKPIYSNVDSKITQKDNVVYADRFESNEEFNDFIMSSVKGRVLVDATPKASVDTVAAPATAPKVVEQEGKPGYPVIHEGTPVGRPKR